MTEKPHLSTEAVTAWLAEYYGNPVESVEPLAGGFWSAAFAFRHEGSDLVIRFNKDPEGFSIDRNAWTMAGSCLPVPEVVGTGEALDFHYAVSRRHFGSFLELADPADSIATGKCLNDLLHPLVTLASRDSCGRYH